MFEFYRDRKCLILAIDFDGTIVQQNYPDMGELMPNIKDVIIRLFKRGHKILIFTARNAGKLEEVKSFLQSKNIPYDAVNRNVLNAPYHSWPKPAFDINYDDRNVGGLIPALEFEQIVLQVENGGDNERIKSPEIQSGKTKNEPGSP